MSPKLGVLFFAEVRDRIDYALRFPQAGTQVASAGTIGVRRLLFDRFKYALVLATLNGELLIVAVHHQRRKPGYWLPRLANAPR